MAKINLKKAFSEVSKAAVEATKTVVEKAKEIDYEEIADKAQKAYEDFDVKEALHATGEKINDAAKTIKNTDKEEIEESFKNFGRTVSKLSKEASQILEDTIEDINQSVALETAAKIIYLAINMDGKIDDQKEQQFKAFYNQTGLEEDMYYTIIEECNSIIMKSKIYDHPYKGIEKGALFIIHEDYYSSKRMDKLELLRAILSNTSTKLFSNNRENFYNAIASELGISQEKASQIYEEFK